MISNSRKTLIFIVLAVIIIFLYLKFFYLPNTHENAKIKFNDGNFYESISECDKILNWYEDQNIRILRAMSLSELNKCDESSQDLLKVSFNSIQESSMLAEIGRIKYTCREYYDAKEFLDQAVELGPKDPYAHFWRAKNRIAIRIDHLCSTEHRDRNSANDNEIIEDLTFACSGGMLDCNFLDKNGELGMTFINLAPDSFKNSVLNSNTNIFSLVSSFYLGCAGFKGMNISEYLNQMQLNHKNKKNVRDGVVSNSDFKQKGSDHLVKQYHKEIQTLVYNNFHPPVGTEGSKARVRIKISAFGKLIDYKVLQYSELNAFNDAVNSLVKSLRNIQFPKNPEGEDDTVIELSLSAAE